MRRSLVFLAAACGSLCLLGPAQGAFPGTNGLIAYTCNLSTTSVCKINPDGTNGGVLVSGASDPAWSPNGQKLVYVSSGGDLYTANADGTGAVLFAASATQPTWSNDNATIAFLNNDGHIWSKSTSSQQQLTNGTADQDPAISPNGQKLVFVSSVSGNLHLFVIPLGGSGIPTPKQLTSGTTDDVAPAWSPDGSTILYETSAGLYKIPAAGGTPTQVVSGDAHAPSYSPDGTKIVYATSAKSIVEADASGSNPTTIVGSLSNADDPDWGTAAVTSGGGGSSPPSDTVNGPTNTSYPVITEASGDSGPIVGHTLTASTGTWSGKFPIAYTYQWKRCDAGDPVNGSCFEIRGATGSSYTVTPTDYQMRIRVAVSATNSDGRHTQNSEVTPIVGAIAPKNTATPPILPGGTNEVDQVLSVSTGTWSGSAPIAYTYSWRRCDPVGDLATCVPIVGATASSYTPTVADIGFSIRVWIVGANLVGSDTVITNHTFPIVDKRHFAPSATIAPAVAGIALPGRQLTANIGTFTGDAPIATSFHWYRCNAVGDACHAISNATKVVYFPTADDVGFTLRLFVFASNAYGNLLARSDPTSTVAANPPHVKGRRIIGTVKGDYLAGGGHDDVIIGRGGNDTILGGAGDDVLIGGPGNDVITGGPGADRIYGGPGSDTIFAADGERDIVDCGPGQDHAIVDAVDIVRNCESVEVLP